MNEIIERVARALYETAYARGHEHCEAWQVMDNYTALARAAIEAMREPTEGMILAALTRAVNEKDCWEAMIDAALSD